MFQNCYRLVILNVNKHINKKEVESDNLLKKYEFLSNESKQSFNDYLDFLLQKNK